MYFRNDVYIRVEYTSCMLLVSSHQGAHWVLKLGVQWGTIAVFFRLLVIEECCQFPICLASQAHVQVFAFKFEVSRGLSQETVNSHQERWKIPHG